MLGDRAWEPARRCRWGGGGMKFGRLLPLLALALTLAILTWAGMRAMAARHFLAARTITTTMIESDQVKRTQIEAATSRIKQALDYLPDHPDYLDLAGNLLELGAEQPGMVGKVHREALQNAADYYRRSLAVRPLWPYAWGNLLAVKDKLGEIDQEFGLALRRSVESGPWEPRVQLQVIRSGLRHWDRLDAAQRKRVRAVILNALQAQPRATFEIIRNYARPDLVCENGSRLMAIKRWCDALLVDE